MCYVYVCCRVVHSGIAILIIYYNITKTGGAPGMCVCVCVWNTCASLTIINHCTSRVSEFSWVYGFSLSRIRYKIICFIRVRVCLRAVWIPLRHHVINIIMYFVRHVPSSVDDRDYIITSPRISSTLDYAFLSYACSLLLLVFRLFQPSYTHVGTWNLSRIRVRTIPSSRAPPRV